MDSLKDRVDLIFARIPQERCSSAFIMTAVGSLSDATLRLANASRTDDGDIVGSLSDATLRLANAARTDDGDTTNSSESNDIRSWKNKRFEITSLVGTFSRAGGCHLHMALSDHKGVCVGGHLINGTVFTTVEVVIGTIEGVLFEREQDDQTGYRELAPKQIEKHESAASKFFKRTSLKSMLVGVCLGAILHHRIYATRS
jgi:predicted DNA-binding protein with PD1-like motif